MMNMSSKNSVVSNGTTPVKINRSSAVDEASPWKDAMEMY